MPASDTLAGPRRRRWRRLAGLLAIAGTAFAGARLLGRARGSLPIHDEASARGAPTAPPSLHASRVGYETEDLRGGTLALILLGLAVTMAVAIGVVFAVVGVFHRVNDPHLAFTHEQQARIDPPPPRLQAAPLLDIAAFRASQAHALGAYAWIDPARTRARVPIDRAMALTVGQSLDAGP